MEEFDLSKLKLRAIMTAAAPLAPELLSAFENKFPGVEVQEVSNAPFCQLNLMLSLNYITMLISV